MKNSKFLYSFTGPGIIGSVWKTENDTIVLTHGKLNTNSDLLITNAQGENVDDIDIKNALINFLKECLVF